MAVVILDRRHQLIRVSLACTWTVPLCMMMMMMLGRMGAGTGHETISHHDLTIDQALSGWG